MVALSGILKSYVFGFRWGSTQAHSPPPHCAFLWIVWNVSSLKFVTRVAIPDPNSNVWPGQNVFSCVKVIILYFDSIFDDICSQWFNLQKCNFASDKDRTIMISNSAEEAKINNDFVYWRMYVQNIVDMVDNLVELTFIESNKLLKKVSSRRLLFHTNDCYPATTTFWIKSERVFSRQNDFHLVRRAFSRLWVRIRSGDIKCSTDKRNIDVMI